MIAFWRKFEHDDSATAIVEYALMLSLVSMVSYAALLAVGTALETFFKSSSAGLEAVATDPK